LSRFGGSAWSLNAATGQYYFHAFLAQQPDLNWRNPEVRQTMYEVMRFWLRRGAAGFRVDASGVLIKDALLRDDPPLPEAGEHISPQERLKRVFTDSRPEALDCLQEMRAVVGEFPETVLAGEADTTTAELARFCGEPDCPRLDLPINFGLHDVAWDALSVQAAIDRYLNTLPSGATPNWALGGHDKPRISSRLGPAQARVAAMLHLTLPGTAFVFAGDEIGMPNVPVPPERIRDPFEKLVPGFNLGRDPERTPMRWTAEPGAGFTTGEPWLPIVDGVETLNVAAQEADPRSMLALFRALGAARRCYAELRSGCYEPLRALGNVVAFRRRTNHGRAILVALNLGQEQQNFPLTTSGRVLLSTHLDRFDEPSADTIRLRPDEAVLILQPA
jgi:alpha-glucosidase